MTAKAITHRIAKLRTTTNEEFDPKAKPLGEPVIKHRKVNVAGEKRPAPKEEVKVKAIVDDGYVLPLIVSFGLFSLDYLYLLFGARELGGTDS